MINFKKTFLILLTGFLLFSFSFLVVSEVEASDFPCGEPMEGSFNTKSIRDGGGIFMGGSGGVSSTAQGEVLCTNRYQEGCSDYCDGGYHCVVVKHKGHITVYQRLLETKVDVGDSISKGGVIGSADDSGVSGETAEYKIFKDGKSLSPDCIECFMGNCEDCKCCPQEPAYCPNYPDCDVCELDNEGECKESNCCPGDGCGSGGECVSDCVCECGSEEEGGTPEGGTPEGGTPEGGTPEGGTPGQPGEDDDEWWKDIFGDENEEEPLPPGETPKPGEEQNYKKAILNIRSALNGASISGVSVTWGNNVQKTPYMDMITLPSTAKNIQAFNISASQTHVHNGTTVNFERWEGCSSGSGLNCIVNFNPPAGGSDTKTVTAHYKGGGVPAVKTIEECRQDIKDAQADAKGKQCTQQIKEMNCSGLLSYSAPNGCEISFLSKRGWSDTPSSCSSIDSFSRNLKEGDKGADVKCLQGILNMDTMTQVASSGPGSKGQETENFGAATKAAVIKFQNKYASEILTPVGLKTGTGIVGQSTINKLDSILSSFNTISKSIKVVYPNGGEKLEIGKKYEIKWESTGVQKVNIYITGDIVHPGDVVEKIACSQVAGAKCYAPCGYLIARNITTSLGKYHWTPSKAYNNARIYVQEAVTDIMRDSCESDASDKSFTVGKATISCSQACKNLEYESSVCKSFAVSPEGIKERNDFKKNNYELGETSDCFVPENIVGSFKSCYCYPLKEEIVPPVKPVDDDTKKMIEDLRKEINYLMAELTKVIKAQQAGSPPNQSEIQRLEKEIARLTAIISELAKNQGGTSAPTMGGIPAVCQSVTFTRNLSVGTRGIDVRCLQSILNLSANFRLALSGPGSPGNETDYFGPITKAAVIKFQEAAAAQILHPLGLTSGTGFVGPSTRKVLNALIGR